MNRYRVALCCAFALCKCLLALENGATAAPPPSKVIIAQPPGPFVENSFPLHHLNGRWQQVYDNSFFGDKTFNIVSFAFFAANSSSISYGNDFIVRMSTTTKEPGGLSSQFASNLGEDQKTVFQGAISLTNTPLTWTKIDLATPFTFNPSAGNLLIDVTHGPALSGNYLAMRAYEPRPLSLQRLIATTTVPGGGPPFINGLASGFGELVTRFDVVIPEPASSTLAITAVLLAGTVRQPRR